jgi:hypothetical protein
LGLDSEPLSAVDALSARLLAVCNLVLGCVSVFSFMLDMLSRACLSSTDETDNNGF